MVATQEEKQQRNFKNLTFRFSIRFNYLLFPFYIEDLLGQMAKTGYTLTVPPPPKIPAKGIRLGGKGKIAQKGDVEIDVNDEKGVLGATSSSPALAMRSLNEMLQLIKDNLGVDLDERAAFYELIGGFDVETDKNPLERIGQISEKSRHFGQFNKILGENISNYTLRLVPRGRIPNQTEWFEIKIEPDVIKPTSDYVVSVIYRSKDKSAVERFTQDLTQKMTSIIDIIES
jgi:hypothetical protein